MIATAIKYFPDVNVEKLRTGFRNFSNPKFATALTDVRQWGKGKSEAFAPAVGASAAIVLAAFGVPVAPLDKRDGRILASPSVDLEVVAATFGRLKTALVGYEAHKAEFYVLSTDCVDTLRFKILTDAKFAEIKALLDRSGAILPARNGQRFRHFTALFSRWPDDKFSTMLLVDDHPDRGSVMFIAGWNANDIPMGVNNGGMVVALKSMVVEVAVNPAQAYWLTESYKKPYLPN
ncbi:MAG: hypothetical protein U9R73_07790 [Pseudomonadota bacterium]|nr:hypothetical protein [Pseudomonadota bacterium]